MSDRRNDIQIGLFSVIGVLLLAMMILIFGGFKDFLADTYTVTAYFKNAAGTSEGTPVRLRGIEVGRVKSISLAAEYGVQMKLDIRQSVNIQADAPLAIRQEGFIANIYLEFGIGTGDKMLAKDGAAVVNGQVETFAAYVERATTVLAEMGVKIGDKVSAVTDKLGTLTDNLNAITGDVQFQTNIKAVASSGAAVTGQLRDKLPGLIDNFNDAAVEAKASLAKSRELFDTYNELGKGLAETNRDVQAQIASQGKNLDELQASLIGTAESISRLSKSVDDIAQAVGRGQGSVGKLITNDDLYRSLVDSIDTISAAAGEFKDLAETLKEHPDWIFKGPPRER